ncbi:MAG TPA: J domain-containing protein [Chloroflexota bacterium]|nr:J domain-containing protein [Chloroflexota bacterium]
MATAPAADTDPYRVLQVAPNADLEVIRASYRRLARLYHPDRNPRPEAAERMRAINAAYGVLSDARRRATYDARRYLRPTPGVAVQYRPAAKRQTVVVSPRPSSPPTLLQRRVDRIVAVLGVLLLIGIGVYVINVIPLAEQQFQAERRGLTTDRLPMPSLRSQPAAANQSGEHIIGAPVPGRLSSDPNLRSFPGTVLVAPQSLPPFSSLPVSRLEATGMGIARYAVYYGDLTAGGATISGLVGRASFDAGAPHIPDCAPEATYCTGLAPGQTAGSGSPGYELFRAADLLPDYPAFVTHRVCCNGVFWSLSWYEPRANMSYTIDLSRRVAALYGSAAIEGDAAAAHAVANLASQLVRLP